MAKIHLKSTIVAGTNKAGILKPDENGYRTVVLGAFSYPNSVGYEYPWTHVSHMFNKSSSLQRRIANKSCRGEIGHPQKEHWMTNDDYLKRLMRIDEKNIVVHIAEAWIDKESYTDSSGNNVIVVLGRVKPTGPKAQFLEDQFNDPEQNVCFSIRSICKQDNVRMLMLPEIIVTWDLVNEPGIDLANKFKAPGLEDFGAMEEIDEVLLVTDLNEIFKENEKAGLESRFAVGIEEFAGLFDLGVSEPTVTNRSNEF